MVLMGMDLPIGAIRGQIAHGLDLMIHLERMRDHSRKLTEVTEVTGLSEGRICLNPLFRFREEEEQNGKIIGRWDRVGTLASTKKLEAAGYLGEYRRLVPDSGD
jgi:pilus assembly protein CpaF